MKTYFRACSFLFVVVAGLSVFIGDKYVVFNLLLSIWFILQAIAEQREK